MLNKYYAYDKKKQINANSFLDYAKNHKRYRGKITARFEGKEKPDGSMCLDITGLEEFRAFGSMIEPMSADELRARIQERNNT